MDLDGIDSSGLAINDAGQITGTFKAHASIYSNGQVTDLGTLGGLFSTGYGINNAGQVTGESATSMRTTHAFLYSNGVLQDLGTLGGTDSYGRSINNVGQVVGQSYTSETTVAAFLYSGGQMYNLNNLIDPALHVILTGATAINDHGQIVANSDNRAYLLTPVPEPSTWALLGVTFLGIATWRRVRKAHP